jgi:YfiH family protein
MNLRIIRMVTGARRLAYMNQVHGRDVLAIKQESLPRSGKAPNVDALITGAPGIALMVRQADCQGVLMYDPVKEVVATAHCGWRGQIGNILAAAVRRMTWEFGSCVSDIRVAIGPSLGPCCAEFINHGQIFPRGFERFMIRENHFDLWALSRWQLLEEGVEADHIEVAGICTKCRTDLFFSYRGEGTTGRFASVVMLKDDSYGKTHEDTT